MKHIFIRHPPLLDMQGICYGTLDINVSQDIMLQHAQALKQQLSLDLPMISSPLQRCYDLARSLNSSFTQDQRLIEMHFGHWQGQAWSAIDRAELDDWAKDIAHYRAPNGENFMDVIARLSNMLDELKTPHILITHAGVIRAAHFLLGDVSVEDAAAIDVPYVTPIYLG
jgi:alpha-ribazole phosphatase